MKHKTNRHQRSKSLFQTFQLFDRKIIYGLYYSNELSIFLSISFFFWNWEKIWQRRWNEKIFKSVCYFIAACQWPTTQPPLQIENNSEDSDQYIWTICENVRIPTTTIRFISITDDNDSNGLKEGFSSGLQMNRTKKEEKSFQFRISFSDS